MGLAESGMAGAMACRPSTCALHLHRAPGLSLVASPRHSSARSVSVLSSASSRMSLNVLAIHAFDPDFYKIPYVEGIPVPSGYRSSSGNVEGIQSSPAHGNKQPPPVYRSTSSSTGYGATEPLSDHGSALSSLVSGGTPSVSSSASHSTQSAPSYGTSLGYGVATSHNYSESKPSNGLRQSPQSHAPSAPGHDSIQTSPSYGTAPVSGGTQPSTIQYKPSDARSYSTHGSSQQAPSYDTAPVSGGTQPSTIQYKPRDARSYSTHGSSQQAPSYNGAESSYSQVNGQSASVPLAPAPSYGSSGLQPARSTSTQPIVSDGANMSSPAPSYGNSSIQSGRSYGAQPVRGNGANMGEGYKNSGTWAAPNYAVKGPQGTGADKSQTSYSSQSTLSSNILNNQSGSAFGKSGPPSYGNSSPQCASSVDKSTTQSSSSYGSNKNNQPGSSYGAINNKQSGSDYGNSSSSSYGDRDPPFVNKGITQSSSSYGSIGSRQPLSYGNTSSQSSSSYGNTSSQFSSSFSNSTRSSFDSTQVGGTSALSNVRASVRSPGSQGPQPKFGYPSMDLYEDAFKNYGVPDAAEVEPWSKDTNFRSGPMYGSPQPSSLNRLFVGNLALSIDDATVQELFSKFGTVLEARVLCDQESGRSRGFGVVAMSSVDEMKAASEALDGWRVDSRPLKVNAVTFKY